MKVLKFVVIALVEISKLYHSWFISYNNRHKSYTLIPCSKVNHMGVNGTPRGFLKIEWPSNISVFSRHYFRFIRSPPDTKPGQTERDTEEKRWIYRLSSVVPRGLNLLD